MLGELPAYKGGADLTAQRLRRGALPAASRRTLLTGMADIPTVGTGVPHFAETT